MKEYDFVWRRPKNKRTWIFKICIFEGLHFDFYEIVKRENILQWKVLFLRVNLTYKLYRCSSLLEEWEEVVSLVTLGQDRFETFILITKQQMKIKKKTCVSFTPFKTRNLLNASISYSFLIHLRRLEKTRCGENVRRLRGILKTRLHEYWKTLNYSQVCYLNPCMYNTYPNPCKGPDHLALPSSCCCRKIVTGAGKTPNISSLRRSLG